MSARQSPSLSHHSFHLIPEGSDTESVRSKPRSVRSLRVPAYVNPAKNPVPSRTLDDVREQVAETTAFRALRKAEVMDDVKISVMLTSSRKDDIDFLQLVAFALSDRLKLSRHLFIVATTGRPVDDGSTNFIIIASSDNDYLQRAVLLTSAKFVGRIESVSSTEDNIWVAGVRDIAATAYDEAALWDVVRKAARPPIDPLDPPPGSRSIEHILSTARARLQRLTALEAYRELQEPEVGAPTFLVDIRSEQERAAQGSIQGSLLIERNSLEWQFDPRSSKRLKIADRYDLRIIVFCGDGSASSLAADSLQSIGLLNATDIIGGYAAWRAEGMPISVPPPPQSEYSLTSSMVFV